MRSYGESVSHGRQSTGFPLSHHEFRILPRGESIHLITNILLTIAVLFLLWWLSATECSYFGRGLLLLLYNSTGRTYESKWRQAAYLDPQVTERLFLKPLLNATGHRPDSQVLDLACGTGRISLLLIASPDFQGSIRAVDLSSGMLRRFRKHLEQLESSQQSRIEIHQGDLNRWASDHPDAYDAVTLLEVGELLPRFESVVVEVARSLKPGGLFLLTRLTPRYAWMFLGRSQRRQVFNRMLSRHGFTEIHMEPWRSRYEVVYATKAG